MPDVTMPRLSDSMEEGTILRWLKSDGDEVKRGDELAEIETDKATMTYEADADGVLKIVAKEGDTLPIGELIATIGEGSGGNGASADAPPKQDEEPEEKKEEPEPEQEEEPEPKQEERPAPKPRESSNGAGERIKASPVAKRMAKEKGVDLSSIQGTGPGGRIVKADVEGAGAGAPAKEAAAPEAPEAPKEEKKDVPAPVAQGEKGTAKGDVAIEELSRTQQVVARRMAESKATVPDFTIQTEIDMERAVAMRAQLKQISDPAPSYNDFVVKACSLALREFPRANGSYKDGKFELFSRINVGIAVAAQNSLVVPTIFDADKKGLGEIARDARTVAERVREGVITPPELSGGTFTVSNLGMFGVTEFTAVINPPQAAILAVGAMSQRPVVIDGEITIRHRMNATLVCDHRILYGADAAQFLARIRELLEEPLALAL